MKITIILAGIPFLLFVGVMIIAFYEKGDVNKTTKVKPKDSFHMKAANDLFTWQGESLNDVYKCQCSIYSRRYQLITAYILDEVNNRRYNVDINSKGRCPVCMCEELSVIKVNNYPDWLDEHDTCLKITDPKVMKSVKEDLNDLFDQWEVIKKSKEYDDYTIKYEKVKSEHDKSLLKTESK